MCVWCLLLAQHCTRRKKYSTEQETEGEAPHVLAHLAEWISENQQVDHPGKLLGYTWTMARKPLETFGW